MNASDTKEAVIASLKALKEFGVAKGSTIAVISQYSVDLEKAVQDACSARETAKVFLGGSAPGDTDIDGLTKVLTDLGQILRAAMDVRVLNRHMRYNVIAW